MIEKQINDKQLKEKVGQINLETKKTPQEILEQLYISAYDMQILNPKMTYANALKYIKEKREEMKKKNLYVPEGQTKVALTKLIRKDCGF